MRKDLSPAIVRELYGKAGDTCFCRKTEKGWDIYGQNVSTHPWKERSYAPQFIASVSDKDIEAIFVLMAEAKAKGEAEAKIKSDAQADRQTWIESLPDSLDHETLIDKHQGIITDNIGNYLMSLPQKPVADLRKYFRESFEVPE